MQLQNITNSKGKGSAKEWAQMKARGGSKIVEMNKSRRQIEKSKERRSVQYSIIGYKVTIAFIIIFVMCKKEGV